MLIFFMFILFINIYSVLDDNGSNYIYKIKKCDGPILIMITSHNDLDYDDYNIDNCSYNKQTNIWSCECNNSFDIVLNLFTYKPKKISVNAEYYINYYDDNNSILMNILDEERVISLSNIEIYPKSRKNVNINSKLILYIILIIILIFLIFGYLIYKKLINNNDNDNYGNNNYDEKEINDMFNNIK
jgi:hypothetical protein